MNQIYEEDEMWLEVEESVESPTSQQNSSNSQTKNLETQHEVEIEVSPLKVSKVQETSQNPVLLQDEADS